MRELPELSLAEIRMAQQRIKKFMAPTPVKRSRYLTKLFGFNVGLKLESLAPSGSFKLRGAANWLLQQEAEELQAGVVVPSAGNHGEAVAMICSDLRIRCTVFMPEASPMMRAEMAKEYGAEVRKVGDGFDQCYQAAVKFQEESGAMFIHPFADTAVIAGNGTIALELLDEIPDLGILLVPVGGGGLIAGIAYAIKELKPDVQIFGVQSRAFPAVKRSLEKNEIVSTAPVPSIADAISVKTPSELTFRYIQRHVEDILLVEESDIAAAMLLLKERENLLIEGAGAAAVAAIHKLSPAARSMAKEQSIACILSGGNIDVNLLSRITTQGMIQNGRLMRIRVAIRDTPGELARVLDVVGRTGSNLVDVRHNRVSHSPHFNKLEVDIDLETIGRSQQQEITDSLSKNKISFMVIWEGHEITENK